MAEEKINHKVKRLSPNLLTKEEIEKGRNDLSRIETNQRLSLLYNQKAFVAVSLSSNEFFESEKNEGLWRLELILEWIQDTFGKIDFLVSDSLYRYYNQILYGLSEKDALLKGIADGEKFIENCREKISQLGLSQTDFGFLKWSEITSEADFKILYEKFKQFYHSNAQLKSSIDASAKLFLDRNANRLTIDYDQAECIARKVIIEELAVFAYMGEIGYTGHIYPATFMQVLTEISEGSFSYLPDELRNQSLCQIKITTK
jgi:tRNA-dependent cyclodipeptide synthase